jgi:adenylate cyclase
MTDGSEGIDIRIDRSFAFVDLCGFTDFVETYGDEAAVEELEVLRSTVRRVASRCGVRVDKWLGDGAMIVGTQIAPMVLAVVTIKDRMAQQSSQLAVRAGIARGPVILHEGDNYVGRAVNLAARLCDHAGAGEILASIEGLELPDGVEAGPPTPVHLKGLARPADCVSLYDAPVEPAGGDDER